LNLLPAGLQHKVRLSHQGIKANLSLRLVDKVTSVFSTVLCDATQQYNKPTSAIDVEGVSHANPLDGQGYLNNQPV